MVPLAQSRRALEIGLYPWKKLGIRLERYGLAMDTTQGCLEWIPFGKLYEP